MLRSLLASNLDFQINELLWKFNFWLEITTDCVSISIEPHTFRTFGHLHNFTPNSKVNLSDIIAPKKTTSLINSIENQ